MHRRLSSSNAFSPSAIGMADANADSRRLSPVFNRPQNGPLDQLEGLNPERAMRLLLSCSPERSPSPVITIGPRITGSNAVGLGMATARQPAGVKPASSQPQDGGAPPLVQVPRLLPQSLPPAIAGVKRPRSQLDEPEPRSSRQRRWTPPVLPPRESDVHWPWPLSPSDTDSSSRTASESSHNLPGGPSNATLPPPDSQVKAWRWQPVDFDPISPDYQCRPASGKRNPTPP